MDDSLLWPVGEPPRGHVFAVQPSGAVRVNGVMVTDEQGWLSLSSRPATDARQVRIRLHVLRTDEGFTRLAVGGLSVGGRVYPSVWALARSPDASLRARLQDAVHNEITLRLLRCRNVEDLFPAGRGMRAVSGVQPAVTMPRAQTNDNSTHAAEDPRAVASNE